jgi:propionate CoA-transferase
VLLEEGHAEDVTWVIEQGAVGGFPATGFAFGCALNPQALVQSVDQFTLLQGGGFEDGTIAKFVSEIAQPGRTSPQVWAARTLGGST